MVGTSASSFIAAGTRGVSIAAGAPVPYTIFAPGINAYKKECTKQGYTPDISFIRLVYLDEDERQIRKEAERYVRNLGMRLRRDSWDMTAVTQQCTACPSLAAAALEA